MDPSAFLVALISQTISETAIKYLHSVQERKDITDIEKHSETIRTQKFVIEAQAWAMRALLSPAEHDRLLDLGGIVHFPGSPGLTSEASGREGIRNTS